MMPADFFQRRIVSDQEQKSDHEQKSPKDEYSFNFAKQMPQTGVTRVGVRVG